MSKEAGTEVTVDTSEGDRALRQLRVHSDITAKAVMESVNKSYQTLVLVADIMGAAIPEWFNLMASAALMAGNMFASLAAAETISGVFAAKAIVTFSIASIMFIRAAQIQMQRAEVERRLNSTLQLLQLYS